MARFIDKDHEKREVVLTQNESKYVDMASRIALEQGVNQESDLKGVMKELNEDVLERDTGLPSIDTKTRLHPYELTSMVIHDAVVALGCLPKACLITTRTKKRLAVSLQGKGRDEMVRIVQGERNKQDQGGFFKNMFTSKKSNDVV